MSDDRREQLLAASFRGVPFSVRSESAADIGRKLILHEYINSDDRYIEDQGKRPPRVTIQAFVHGPDFRDRAASLERALNEKGPGRLSTPNFGVIEAYAGSYSKDASQKTIGEISFSIEFYSGRRLPGPAYGRSTSHEVFQAGDEALSAVERDFEKIYRPAKTIANRTAATGDLLNIVHPILAGAKSFVPAKYMGLIEDIVREIGSQGVKAVHDPKRLARLLFFGLGGKSGMWKLINLGLSRFADGTDGADAKSPEQSSGGAVERLRHFSNVGGGLSLLLNEIHRGVSIPVKDHVVPLWPSTTGQRIDRNNRRLLMSNANRVAALTNLYVAAATRSYDTDTEIAEVRSDAERIYDRIMRQDVGENHDLIQSQPEVRAAVDKVRTVALDVIAQREQEALKLADDTIPVPTPVMTHAYARYAESLSGTGDLGNRTGQLSGLNVSQSSIAVKKRMRVFA